MARWWGLAVAGCVAMSTAAAADDKKNPFDPFAITVGGSIASDYVYRGVSLSARGPTVGSDIEILFHKVFYVQGAINSVSLPTSPSAEVAVAAGYRPTFFNKKLELDLGVVYYWYPKEMIDGVPTNTDYWEAQVKATLEITSGFNLKGEFSWSPNIGKTGAWSRYSEAGFSYDVSKLIKPPFGLEAEISGGVGRYWFGAVMPELGDYRLPAYTYWHVGIEFSYEIFSFDLRYHNTNLSKENCFIFTGDPTATPGGAVNDVSNPDGLRSRWCGATVVGTLKFEFEPK